MKHIEFKKIIQFRGENLAYEAKCLLKSHSISIFFQFLLLFIPIIIWTISLNSELSDVWEIIWFLTSILALVYYLFYWKNSQLYKEYGEKYISLHNDLKTYYIGNNYSEDGLNQYKIQQDLINDKWKPNTHFFSLFIVNLMIEKEMISWNEKELWWNNKT